MESVEHGAPSRWRWVVLTASFFCQLLTGFGQYQAGVMKVLLLRHTDIEPSAVTWLMSYYAGAFALVAPVASLLVSTVNCRASGVLSGLLCLVGFVLSSLVTDVTHLFLTLTLVGLGQSMSNTASLVVLGYYFPGRAALVTGVSVAGGALGIFLHPPLLQALSRRYGFSGALLLSGAVALQGSVCGALMRPTRLEKKMTRSKHQGNNGVQGLCRMISGVCSGHVRLLTSWRLLSFLLACFFFSLAVHSVYVQLPYNLIQRSGLSATQASFSISVTGVGSFFSRVASGVLAHDPRVGSLLVYVGTSGTQALVSLAAPALMAQGVVEVGQSAGLRRHFRPKCFLQLLLSFILLSTGGKSAVLRRHWRRGLWPLHTAVCQPVGSLLVYDGTSGMHALVSLAASALMAQGVVGAYAYCLMLGLYTGACFAMQFPVVYEIVGMEHYSTAYGMVFFCIGVGGLLGAPLTEMVYAESQSPYILFGFLGALFLAASLFAGLVTVLPSPAMLETSAAQGKPLSASNQSLQQTGKVPEQETLLSVLETKTETEIPEQETRLLASKSIQQTGEVPDQETFLSAVERKHDRDREG